MCFLCGLVLYKPPNGKYGNCIRYTHKCKICHSDPYCDHCFPEFFRNPGNESCVPKYGYCLAEDRKNWECVNCKDKGLYNLNSTCVDKAKLPISLYNPDPYFEGKEHHSIDNYCNLVSC